MAAVSKGSNVWSMKLKGTMDTTEIDKGVKRVKKGFDGVKGKAKSFGGDMRRVASTVSGLAKKLIFLGLAGGSALVALASKAPAVAPALAKMSVSMMKLKMSLGEALAPAFERVAVWLDKLAIWVGNNKEQIAEVAGKFLDWAEAVGEKLWPVLEKVGTWAADHPGLFLGIVAGLALAPAVLSGILAMSNFITLLGGATISAALLSALGVIGGIMAGLGISYVSTVGGANALIDSTKAGQGTPVPIGGSAISQITNAEPVELMDLQNKYADRITSGYGPEQTARVDIESGELYGMEHMQRDIMANANVSYDYHNHEETRKSWWSQMWQSVWG